MKAFKITLKILLLILTAFFGLCFNIMGGIALIKQNYGMVDAAVNIGIAMIVITAVCFVGGTVLVMLNKSLIASFFAVAGIIGMTVLYTQFAGLTLESSDINNAADLFMNNHMPSILISVVIIILAAVENIPMFAEKLAKKKAKQNAPAPSILGGVYEAEGKKENV